MISEYNGHIREIRLNLSNDVICHKSTEGSCTQLFPCHFITNIYIKRETEIAPYVNDVFDGVI